MWFQLILLAYQPWILSKVSNILTLPNILKCNSKCDWKRRLVKQCLGQYHVCTLSIKFIVIEQLFLNRSFHKSPLSRPFLCEQQSFFFISEVCKPYLANVFVNLTVEVSVVILFIVLFWYHLRIYCIYPIFSTLRNVFTPFKFSTLKVC